MVVSGQASLQASDEQSKDEVDRMVWVDADQAATRLSYPDEKTLVTQNWARRR
jgi:hypothetical protein